MKKATKQQKDERRTGLKHGLRDALSECKAQAARHVHPLHSSMLDGADVLTRLSLPLFGPPANKVCRVEKAGVGVKEDHDQVQREGGREGIEEKEVDGQGVEDMEWYPAGVAQGREEGRVLGKERREEEPLWLRPGTPPKAD